MRRRGLVTAWAASATGAAWVSASWATSTLGGDALSLPDEPTGKALEAAARYSASHRGVSMLVMRDAKVIFEQYPNEGAVDRAWELASGTKSYVGILAAAAVADGWLSLEEPCAGTLTEWADDASRRDITVRQLLTLTSGIASGAIGRPQGYAESMGAPKPFAVGERYQYGPAPFQIFGELVRRKLVARNARQRDPASFIRARVLEPIAAQPSTWRVGPDGMPLLPQGVAATARAWAAFGQFVLSGGPGLDAAALAACFQGTQANPGYGLTWWLLRPGLVGPGPRSGVDGVLGETLQGDDVVMAAGAGDQRLYLLRKRKLVVVRQATGILAALTGRGTGWEDVTFLRTLLSA